MTEVWDHANALATGLQHRDAEHVFAEPRGRPTRPSVAEAMPKPDVAISPVAAMDVFLPRRHQFVDPRGVGHPIEIEVFPKRSRPDVEHRAPVLGNEVERGIGLTRLCECLQHVEAVECGNIFRAADFQHGLGGLARVPHAGEHQQRRSGFGRVDVGHYLAPALRGVGAEGGRRSVAQFGKEASAGLERHHEQRLKPSGDPLLVW